MTQATQAKQIFGLPLPTYIFSPGASAGSLAANQFNSWTDLQAASASYIRISVTVDDSFTSPAQIPAGSWPNVAELRGSNTASSANGFPTEVQFVDGCVLPNCKNLAQLAISTVATALYPLSVTDNEVLSIDGCTITNAGSIGSIHATPGTSSSPPTISCDSTWLIANSIGTNTIDIEPSASVDTAFVSVNLVNAILASSAFNGLGPFAAEIEVDVTVFDTATNQFVGDSSSTSQPGVASVVWLDLSDTDVIHYGARVVTTASPGTPRVVAAWQNATDYPLIAGVPDPGMGSIPVTAGLRTFLRGHLVSSVDGAGKHVTIQLWKNGVEVSGASLLIGLGITGDGAVNFADSYADSDIYTVTMTLSGAVASATDLLVSLA